MRARSGHWAVYQNQDPTHQNFLHLLFMRYGDGTPFAEPPEFYPSDASVIGPGRRYLHVGFVDLESGNVVAEEKVSE